MTNSKNMHLTKTRRVWGISTEDFVVLGYGDSVEIPTGFSVGMGWVWGLKSNPHGSTETTPQTVSAADIDHRRTSQLAGGRGAACSPPDYC